MCDQKKENLNYLVPEKSKHTKPIPQSQPHPHIDILIGSVQERSPPADAQQEWSSRDSYCSSQGTIQKYLTTDNLYFKTEMSDKSSLSKY